MDKAVADEAVSIPSRVDASGLLSAGSEGLYRLLVESVRDYAIFALDPEGHILTWNVGAERIKGYKASEIIGRHFSIFYQPDEAAQQKPAMELEIATREGRYEEEGWRVRKDGSLFWANVIITALRNPAGKVVGFGKVTRDLTERKEAQERALADARRIAEVEASNRAKSNFLAAMSHELRTPLNAIGGYAELLAMGVRGPVTREQKEDLDRIRRSQLHLLAIINDLLNYSRIEAGRITYDIERVPVGPSLATVVEMMELLATGRQITLEFTPGTEEIAARADRAKLEQILVNLTSNALKFTNAGGFVVLSATAQERDVEIAVRDTGRGIPHDKLEEIFEPFVQVGRSLTHGNEGTGLGLAISRDLARAMGGEIGVESRLGEGSTFTLRLPRAD